MPRSGHARPLRGAPRGSSRSAEAAPDIDYSPDASRLSDGVVSCVAVGPTGVSSTPGSVISDLKMRMDRANERVASGIRL
jgi:hypothetical protein